MIYQSKTGVCNFDNIEFNTQLTFGGDGRKNNFEFDQSLPTIAVLGDSHAMGWGVGDDEKFSAQLQRITGRRVFNLGVSSYATEREIDRFSTFDESHNIDTVIIQYCDSDLNANLSYPINRSVGLKLFQEALKSYSSPQVNVISRNFYSALKQLVPQYHLKDLSKALIGQNSATNHADLDHRKKIESILIQYEAVLRDKNVIVFFTSAHNRNPTPQNWTGSFIHHRLNVSFVSTGLEDDYFYVIDDHLNEYGHAQVANKLSALIK